MSKKQQYSQKSLKKKKSWWPRLRAEQYGAAAALAAALLFLPGMNISDLLPVLIQKEVVRAAEQLPQQPQDSTLVRRFSLPMLRTAMTSPLPSTTFSFPTYSFPLTAQSVYVFDRDSGSILYQLRPDELRAPASTAKIMTALVARKVYNLTDVLSVKEEAFSNGTVSGLVLGEKLTVSELLKGLLISSGNDAAFVLANNHPDGYSAFIDEMNRQAQLLHLDQTTFSNASGLDNINQRATARDLGILAKELMKDPVLKEIVGTRQTTMRDVTGNLTHPLSSTQELLGVVPGVVGIKTGTTESAGENLITEVDRNGRAIILVILGSQNRFLETRQMIDWLFETYTWQPIDL